MPAARTRTAAVKSHHNIMAKRSFLRRQVGRAGSAVKGRYFAGKGFTRPKLNVMVRDVARAKTAYNLVNTARLLNVEKKRSLITATSQIIGQLNANNGDQYMADMTPVPAQGVGYNQHTGSSIKIVSCHMTMQFWSQSAYNHSTKLILEIFKIRGASQVPATFTSDYFTPNPSLSVSIIDYESNKDPDYFGQARLLIRKKFSVPAPQFAGEIMQRQVNIGRKKLSHHIRYDQNTTTIDDGQLIMVIRADSGNSGTISTVTGAPVLAANTGLNFNYNMLWYYVDN